MVCRSRQAGCIADGAVDIADGPAGPADDVVVVIADPRLVTSDRTRGLDASHQTGIGQGGQNVIDRLPRHLGQVGPYRTEDGVGIGVRVGVHSVQNSDAGTRHPQLGVPQLLGEIRCGWHTPILSRFLESVKCVSGGFGPSVRFVPVPLSTVAIEMVAPNTDRSLPEQLDEARKVARISAETGIAGQIGHVMIPGMIDEDDDRPVEMKPKLDVLDYWQLISPELPGVKGLCTQVTAFSDETELRRRLADLIAAGMEGIAFVGVPRTMADGEGAGVAPTDALAIYRDLVPNRGAILIPTRAGEVDRFGFKCRQGATYGMTQLLYSDAIVEFLTEFSRVSDHRPEILLSFGFVPKVENRVGLISWLIQDAGNATVAAEQDFVKALAAAEPADKRRLIVDLYKRVIDGVADLGFPLSIHFEATYGYSAPAFETFADMLAYWSPRSP